MESRSERYRKQKQQKPARKKTQIKVLAGWSLAAVACFIIGASAAYLSSKSAPAGDMQTVSTPAPQTSASPQPSASPSTSKESAKPTPAAAKKAASETSAPAASVKPGSPGSQVKLSFVGDVLLASKVEDILMNKGYDYPYSNVKEYLSSPDYTVANLETPFTTRGTAQSKDYVYRSNPDALPALKASGIDLLNLANNHIMDYGEEGLLDTMDELDRIDLKRIGAGKDKAEAYEPVIVEKQGMKIAFLGFSRVVPEQSWKAGTRHPGVAETYDYRAPVEAISEAKKQADLVVVIAHWGQEREDNPDKYQQELAHRYIDAGADLIVGGHPHVLQGFENYKGKWIAYSLGNFIFTTNENPKTWETAIMEAACTKDKQCDIHLVPIITKSALPTPMNEEDGGKLFERLTDISIEAGVDADGNVYEK